MFDHITPDQVLLMCIILTLAVVIYVLELLDKIESKLIEVLQTLNEDAP